VAATSLWRRKNKMQMQKKNKIKMQIHEYRNNNKKKNNKAAQINAKGLRFICKYNQPQQLRNSN